MIERLPTPWGLVRLGVAPDHPKLKEVSRAFERIAARPGYRFLGNVEVGKTVSHEELLQAYDAVVYAVGAQTDRRLGIPGEDLPGSWSATELVAWYNGHPDFQELQFDLSVERAVVVGNGNVALDVARMLALTREELQPTDTTDAAIEAIVASGIREIVVLGRRGPVQAAWTPAELAELGELAGADVPLDPAELELDPASEAELEAATPIVKRNIDVLRDFAAREPTGKPRSIRLRFRVSPVAFLGVRADRGRRARAQRPRAGRQGQRPRRRHRRARGASGRDRLSQRGLPGRRTCPGRRSTSPRGRSPTTVAVSSARREARCPASTAPAGSSAARPGSSGRTRRMRPRRSTSCSPTSTRASSPWAIATAISRPCSRTAGWTSSCTRAGRRSTSSSARRGAPHGRPRVKLASWNELIEAAKARG